MNTQLLVPRRNLARAQGFSLVELMIGMILGLLVIGGVIGVFVATQQANRTTEGLSSAQGTQRIAFELLSRSIREAGGNYCGKNLPATDDSSAGVAFYRGANPLFGLDGAAANPAAPYDFVRIPGTDAIRIFSSSLGESFTITSPGGPFIPPAAPPVTFTLNRAITNDDFKIGSLATVCDYTQVSLFTVTAPRANAGTVSYTPPAAANPPFILPRNAAHSFMLAPALIPATLTPFVAEFWYIGAKGAIVAGDPVQRSLWRRRLDGAGAYVNEEILENVTDMQITYSRLGAAASQVFVPASAAWTAADWDNVIAVRITLTIETPVGSTERADNTQNADADNDGVLEDVATADIRENLTARRTLTQTVIVRSRAK